MKKLKLSLFAILTFAFLGINAQLKEIWTSQLTGTLGWHKVTNSGFYLVSTNQGLFSYDQETGAMLWSNPNIRGFQEQEIQEMEGSPFLIVERQGTAIIIDPFDGSVRFNSQDAGLAAVTNRAFLVQSNGILIAGRIPNGEQKMLMVDNNNVKIAWTIEEKFGRIIAINELSNSEILVTTLFNIYKINTKSGDVIWKNATSPEAEKLSNMGAFGNLMKGLAENMAKDMEFVIRYYQYPEKGIFVIANETANETTTTTGTPTVNFENNYMAFNINDGSRIWNKAVQMKGKLGDLVFYGNGIIVLPDDGNNSMINYFEFVSEPKGMWGKNGRGTKIRGGVYSHVETDKGILLVTRSGNNNFLNLLNPATGEMAYDKPVKIDGEVMGAINSPRGIAYVTTNEVNMIDPTTGNLLLSKSISTTPGLTTFHNNTIYAFDLSRGVIRSLDINTGAEKDVTTERLRFEGKEQPNSIEIREAGILLTSEQNMAMYDMSGNLKFNKYFKAPRESGLKRALLMAQAARAAYISANAFAAAGMLQAATADAYKQDALAGAIVEGMGMAYEDLGRQGSEFAKRAFQNAQARFKATAEGRFYNIILSEVDKSNALLKVNRDTGEVEATIDLGREKEPKYAVDDVTGKVFVAEKDIRVNCYQF
jgi:outer membrane protein assembly factor BamB